MWLTQPVVCFLVMAGMGGVLTREMLFVIPPEIGDHSARWFIVASYWIMATIVVTKVFLLRLRDRRVL